MTDFQTISTDLVHNLKLQYEPVGIKIYQDSDPLPDISFSEKELKSYCQAVILAGEGQTHCHVEQTKPGIKIINASTLL